MSDFLLNLVQRSAGLTSAASPQAMVAPAFPPDFQHSGSEEPPELAMEAEIPDSAMHQAAVPDEAAQLDSPLPLSGAPSRSPERVEIEGPPATERPVSQAQPHSIRVAGIVPATVPLTAGPIGPDQVSARKPELTNEPSDSIVTRPIASTPPIGIAPKPLPSVIVRETSMVPSVQAHPRSDPPTTPAQGPALDAGTLQPLPQRQPTLQTATEKPSAQVYSPAPYSPTAKLPLIEPAPRPVVAVPPLSGATARPERPRTTHVRIGRIEVRATPSPPAAVPAAPTPTYGFDGYVRLRTYATGDY